MTRRYLYIEKDETSPKLKDMIFLWLTHPTKPIDVFRHLERARDLRECLNAFLPKHATLYCTHDASPLLPQKVQSEGFPPKRPRSFLGAAFGSSRERREGNERTKCFPRTFIAATL